MLYKNFDIIANSLAGRGLRSGEDHAHHRASPSLAIAGGKLNSLADDIAANSGVKIQISGGGEEDDVLIDLSSIYIQGFLQAVPLSGIPDETSQINGKFQPTA